MGETHGENIPKDGRGCVGGPIGSPPQARSSDRTAIARLREAAKAHPEDPVAWYNLGDALLAEGNSKDSLAPLRKAVDQELGPPRAPRLGDVEGWAVPARLTRLTASRHWRRIHSWWR